MANFTAKDVNELRKSTGVGMMDCKKALTEADGDVEKAIELLREKGLATQAKKAGRVAAEGMVVAKVNADNSVGCVVEVNSETDFVANTDEFKAFVNQVADTIIEKNPADVEALKATTVSGGTMTVDEALQELFLKIRENLQIRRFVRMEGILVPYIHGGGKIGVLVTFNVEGIDPASDAFQKCGRDIAMQVAALNPVSATREDVPADVAAHEMEIYKAQAAESGKPEAIQEKIALGRMDKFYKENCLLQQEFVRGDVFTGTVEQYIADAAKKLGGKIDFVDAVRFEKGEGIEKKQENFAEEIASMIKG